MGNSYWYSSIYSTRYQSPVRSGALALLANTGTSRVVAKYMPKVFPSDNDANVSKVSKPPLQVSPH